MPGHRAALLRLDDRQAHRLRQRPRHGDGRMSRALDEFVIRGIKTTVLSAAHLRTPISAGAVTVPFVEGFIKQRASLLPPRKSSAWFLTELPNFQINGFFDRKT